MEIDKYEISRFIRDNRSISTDYIANSIVEEFKTEMVPKEDIELLKLVFDKNPSQQDFDEFIKNWDIEVEGGNHSLLLAYFIKMHPQIKVPEYSAPRLKGLLKFHRFHNMRLISQYTKICRELEKSNIEFLILKGGAMKHLRPEYPRLMSDIDILVHEKDFEKAKQIVKKMGYLFFDREHSIDLYKSEEDKSGILDIHHRLSMLTGYENRVNEDFFKRAKKENVFGIDTLVPCFEDMVFIALVNLSKNLVLRNSVTGILFTLFDCKSMIDSKPDFNWDIVRDNARKTKTETQIFMTIRFINRIVPELLPEEIVQDKSFGKEFSDYCTLLAYNRFFLLKLREQSRSMKLKDAIKTYQDFKNYLTFRPKYFIYKRKMIRKSPTLARKVLLKQKEIL